MSLNTSLPQSTAKKFTKHDYLKVLNSITKNLIFGGDFVSSLFLKYLDFSGYASINNSKDGRQDAFRTVTTDSMSQHESKRFVMFSLKLTK